MRHRIFVGSSTENVRLAESVQRNLVRAGHLVKVWDQGIFSIGKTAFDALLVALDKYDAAVFVFAPNDLVTIRGQDFGAVRDNVVFELGLFTGRLGRDRTFWVVPQGETQLRIASDLLGVLPAVYVEPPDDDWVSALTVPCQQIHEALRESARDRGSRGPALSTEVAAGCVPQINRVMEHLRRTVTSNRIGVAGDGVEALPDGRGFRVLLSGRADLTATFGRIEDCPCDAEESIVALPANEFFDDACIFDHRSALGAFVGTHFGDRIDAFKRTVSEKVRVLRQALVEREVGEFQESYGVGTSLLIKVPGVPEKRVILSAVTRKRAGEGIKAEPTYVFASVQAISRIMNDERLTDLYVPLLGSGHGDMDHDLALLCLALALANTPDIRHANIVIFRRTPEATPILAPEIVRKILSFVAGEARG